MRSTLCFILIFPVCYVRSQLAAQTPEFEVAAIHRSTESAGIPLLGFSVEGGGVRIYNYSVAQWISIAYEIPADQVSGPGWITSDRFDLWAKLPPEATKHDVPSLLRSLMMKNFELRVHKEVRNERALVLLTAKSGAKLREATIDRFTGASRPLRGALSPKPGSFNFRCNGCTLSHFAGDLSKLLHEAVIDLSGLDGTYDIPYTIAGVELATRAVNRTTRSLDDDDLPPSILDALRELGLRLERQVAPVERLVVDNVARPSEN
jgi:uncharacterized protein (TIGR03435 family)